MDSRLKAWLQLIETKDLGPVKAHQLISSLGEPESFIGKGIEPLLDYQRISNEIKESLAVDTEPENWENICELSEKYQIKYTTILDDDYPAMLKNIFNPPLVLYYRGTLPKDDGATLIGIVGTRKPDNYGIMMTQKITGELSRSGYGIVSGLAFGVDTHAHRTTIENNGITYAVMGTGCDQIYPESNRKLAERILERGALISEFTPGSKLERWNFPARNRVISGLSNGIFVVQGKISSGALLTAKYALEHNRDLFALPGDINRPQSEGPNHLIKKGAKLVSSYVDIVEEYDLIMTTQVDRTASLSDKEKGVLNCIQESKPAISYDELILKTGYNVGDLSTVLLALELQNLIRIGDGTMISSVD